MPLPRTASIGSRASSVDVAVGVSLLPGHLRCGFVLTFQGFYPSLDIFELGIEGCSSIAVFGTFPTIRGSCLVFGVLKYCARIFEQRLQSAYICKKKKKKKIRTKCEGLFLYLKKASASPSLSNFPTPHCRYRRSIPCLEAGSVRRSAFPSAPLKRFSTSSSLLESSRMHALRLDS